jgi:DNA topoisomerase-1
MSEGERADLQKMDVKSHMTKAIARYTEASLIKELESRGIGRPSTYATIMDTIVRREYVFKQGTALVPTFVAFAVVGMMEKYFTHLVDYTFTAEMEEDLDKIANGELKSVPYLDSFYNGSKGHEGLTKLIAQEIDARSVCTIPLVHADKEVVGLQIRIGRFGPYIEQGEKKAPIPDDTAPADLTAEKAQEMLDTAKPAGEEMGADTSGLKIQKKVGRFGPYLQLGEKDDKGFKMKSIPKFMSVDELTMEQAHEILSWPKLVGKLPTGSEVMFDVGPYGPYIKVDGKNRSVPEGYDVIKLTIEDVEKILATPIEKGKGFQKGARVAAPPLKDFGNGVMAKTGRYGAYVTDGKTNASIPKGTDAEKMTAEEAMELIKNKQK